MRIEAKLEIFEPDTIANIVNNSQSFQDINTGLSQAIEYYLLEIGFTGDDAFEAASEIFNAHMRLVYEHE